MTTFDKREDAFERKFVRDAEMQFKAHARRNKQLGLWAASLLGKTGADAEVYAQAVVACDVEHPGHEEVFRKIRGDFDAAGVSQSDHQIRRTMEEQMAKVMEQMRTEKT